MVAHTRGYQSFKKCLPTTQGSTPSFIHNHFVKYITQRSLQDYIWSGRSSHVTTSLYEACTVTQVAQILKAQYTARGDQHIGKAHKEQSKVIGHYYYFVQEVMHTNMTRNGIQN